MKVLRDKALKLRQDTFLAFIKKGEAHLGGSFSIIEILITLFYKILKKNDKFILSKSHASFPFCIVLKEKGYKPPTREKCLWWNNGEHNTMSIIQPGAEWIRGRISFWWTNGKENKFATKAPGLSWNKGRVTPWLGKEK
jgi:hypothetical protein